MNKMRPSLSIKIILIIVLTVQIRFALAQTSSQVYSEEVEPAKISDSVASSLVDWGILGPVSISRFSLEYADLISSIAQKIQGIRGFSESNNLNGDGTDWYEVEFSPDLANDMRTVLKNSTTVKTLKKIPNDLIDLRPVQWWPINWPANTKFYYKDLDYLVLPEDGNRGWFMRTRI